MRGYKDISDETEDARIKQIGEFVMGRKEPAVFITDDDPGKADRYIKKLQERFPGIHVVDRFDGPTPGVVTVRVAPPKERLQ